MKIYTYSKDNAGDLKVKPERGEWLNLQPVEYSKEQSERILNAAKGYKIAVNYVEEYDPDEGFTSYNAKDSETEVPQDQIVVKDGAFYGYFYSYENVKGWGESENYHILITIEDKRARTVKFHGEFLSSGCYNRETSHRLIKKDEV